MMDASKKILKKWCKFGTHLAQLLSNQSSVNIAYASQMCYKVTFGTVLSVAAHAINVLPWTSPRLSLRYFSKDFHFRH